MFSPARLALVILLTRAAGGLLFGDDLADRQMEFAAARSTVLRDRLGGRVTVTVEDGIATLRGRLDTPDQKVLAETAVDLIPNVVGIDDQIRVGGPKIYRSDGWILLHLKAELLMRPDVSAETRVTVHDGEVILGGSAPSIAQKELTGQYARALEGVSAVINDMTVSAPPLASRPTFVGDEAGSHHWDDPSITAQVRFELLQRKIHVGPRLHIRTRQGVVTLTGRAFNQDEKELIARSARAAPGVHEVVDLLSVRGQ